MDVDEIQTELCIYYRKELANIILDYINFKYIDIFPNLYQQIITLIAFTVPLRLDVYDFTNFKFNEAIVYYADVKKFSGGYVNYYYELLEIIFGDRQQKIFIYFSTSYLIKSQNNILYLFNNICNVNIDSFELMTDIKIVSKVSNILNDFYLFQKLLDNQKKNSQIIKDKLDKALDLTSLNKISTYNNL